MNGKTDTWLPLFTGSWLRETLCLTYEQQGIYLRLRIAYWTNGPFPDDRETLRRITGLLPTEWDIHEPVLMPFFTRGADGRLHHDQWDIDKARANDHHEKSQKGGRKRGQSGKRGADGKFTSDQPSDTATATSTSPASDPAVSQPESQPNVQPKTSYTIPVSPSPTLTTNPQGSVAVKDQAPRRGGGDSGFANGPPSPAAGFSNGNGNETGELSLRDQAHMVAQAVKQATGMTEKWALIQLAEQAEVELKDGATMDEVRDGMIYQFRLWRECKRLKKLTPAARSMSTEKFLGEGIWKDTNLWDFKKGENANGIVL